MSLDGRLFENIDVYVEKIRKLKSEKFEVKVQKRKIRRMNEFQILDDLKVLGVDGSQLQPLRDFGIPFGGVQAAGIILHHGKGEFQVFHRSKVVSDTNIDFERFRLEIEVMKDNLERADIAFFDGSLRALYTAELSEALKKAYQREIESLLKKSERLEIPVIGYVDRSFTRDLGFGIYDSMVLSDYLEIYEFTSPLNTDTPLKALYFKLTPFLPARIEIPEWCEHVIDEIVEVVYAESRLGSTNAYPYILERAHSYAKISEREKSAFLRALKSMGISFKFISKVIE